LDFFVDRGASSGIRTTIHQPAEWTKNGALVRSDVDFDSGSGWRGISIAGGQDAKCWWSSYAIPSNQQRMFV
jgi:hypothetical protein